MLQILLFVDIDIMPPVYDEMNQQNCPHDSSTFSHIFEQRYFIEFRLLNNSHLSFFSAFFSIILIDSK